MKAVVYRGPYNVAVEEARDPRAKPSEIISHELPLADAPSAYDQFDKRVNGYTKVLLHPAA